MSDEIELLRTTAVVNTSARVLVVDDTEGNRYAVAHLLRGAGMDVTEAATGREALECVKEVPDLVILDINLPDMSGRDVLRHIRADPEVSWLPVMHLSASYTASEDQARGLDMGADAYQTHPLDPEVFLATTRALLRLGTAEAKVRRASQEWRAAFDSLSDAIFIVDTDKRQTVQRCNTPAANIIGTGPRELVGMSWEEVLDALGADPDNEVFHAGFAKPSGHMNDVELKGRWYHVSMLDSASTADGGFCVCVLRDVTERKDAEREREKLVELAEAARMEAEKASRAKGEFLAVMSHELRTPLNAIGGYVDLLAMGIRGPITTLQAFDLDRIKRSQTSLTILINDVLNFAKAESGELQYNISAFPVKEALDRSSEVVEPQLEMRGLSFNRDDPESELLVRADINKLQQVILNLLSNAIKFTPAGGRITVSSQGDGERVAITVRDTGPGIPDFMRDAIFEPFIQAHSTRTGEHSGVGLGLAISRDLARGMGGELTVIESSSAGTAFLLTLPRS